MVFTAAHDMDSIKEPIVVDISKSGESYTLLNGQEKELIPGDMLMKDGNGVISSIIYGPDNLTQIKNNTKNVLYVVYAPPGVKEELLEQHLQDISQYTGIASPGALPELNKIYKI